MGSESHLENGDDRVASNRAIRNTNSRSTHVYACEFTAHQHIVFCSIKGTKKERWDLEHEHIKHRKPKRKEGRDMEGVPYM
jgi:hypothetical protein